MFGIIVILWLLESVVFWDRLLYSQQRAHHITCHSTAQQSSLANNSISPPPHQHNRTNSFRLRGRLKLFLMILSLFKKLFIGIIKGGPGNFLILFLAIPPSILHQMWKVRSVLKSACSEDFKTDLTFEFWPIRSWENWDNWH